MINQYTQSLFTRCYQLGVGMIFIGLSGCSGDSESDARPTSVPSINQATTFNGPLTTANEDAVSRFIKNGIYSSTLIYTDGFRLDSPSLAPESIADSTANGFSVTNTQEIGVDEADRIKYDGQTLFVATEPYWQGEQQVPARVRILERQPDWSLTETASVSLEDEANSISGIYTHQTDLVVINNSAPVYALHTFAPEPWMPDEARVSLAFFDTSVPSSPIQKASIDIDGTMLASRRIGDFLYLVTGYTASVSDLNTLNRDDEAQLENYLKILDTPIENLMPQIYTNGDEGTLLNQAADCVIPQQASAADGYAHLLSVTRISMSNPSDVTSSCISAVSEVIYMSSDNLYLTSSADNQTVIHKVALDQSLTYQATGAVDGIIGWRGAPNLRLSEYQDTLRIVSSDYQHLDGPSHALYLLQQDGNRLNVISQLPNQQQPTPIGKPGEDVFAVRFFDERAYVVTFERIDPLYVIDLSQVDAPAVLGELEIPGFSSYLHPLDNGLLLGVGQQVETTDIPRDGAFPTEPVTQQGMKLSLFDVNDPTAPTELNNLVFDSAYTPVEYDYRALSVLNSNGQYRFALPIESWSQNEQGERRAWQPVNKLLMLEVDSTANTPEVIQRGEIVAPTNDTFYYFGGQDRSVLHGEHLYYIRGEQVFHSLWQEGADVSGPF